MQNNYQYFSIFNKAPEIKLLRKKLDNIVNAKFLPLKLEREQEQREIEEAGYAMTVLNNNFGDYLTIRMSSLPNLKLHFLVE